MYVSFLCADLFFVYWYCTCPNYFKFSLTMYLLRRENFNSLVPSFPSKDLKKIQLSVNWVRKGPLYISHLVVDYLFIEEFLSFSLEILNPCHLFSPPSSAFFHLVGADSRKN